jgi:hypothetical protein
MLAGVESQAFSRVSVMRVTPGAVPWLPVAGWFANV